MSKITVSETALSRRGFIVGSTAIAGAGLTLGFHVPVAEAQTAPGAQARGQRLGRDQAG